MIISDECILFVYINMRRIQGRCQDQIQNCLKTRTLKRNIYVPNRGGAQMFLLWQYERVEWGRGARPTCSTLNRYAHRKGSYVIFPHFKHRDKTRIWHNNKPMWFFMWIITRISEERFYLYEKYGIYIWNRNSGDEIYLTEQWPQLVIFTE